MRVKFFSRSVMALAVVAAAVFAVGVGAKGADAQTTLVSTNGPYAATAGVPTQFTGTAAVGPLASAVWSFSDGTSIAGLSVYKSFYSTGIYTATVSVTNIYGQSFSASTTVSVASPYSLLSATPFLPSTLYPTTIYPSTVSPTTIYWPAMSLSLYTCRYGTVLVNNVLYCR